MAAQTASSFSEHAARAAALSELHARPAPVVETPTLLYRVVLSPREDNPHPEERLIDTLCRHYGCTPPASSARYCSIATAGGELRWEQHTEFATCTYAPHAGNGNAADAQESLQNLQALAQDGQQLLAGMHLHITAHGAQTEDQSAENPNDLCISGIAAGRAMLTTRFLPGADGFVRYDLINRSLPPAECGVFAQRILEIETYRMLALMALPLARSAGAAVQTMEQQLQQLTKRLDSSENDAPAQDLFSSLSDLSVRIESEIAATTYRFAAAIAYGAIVEDRLASLRETAHDNHPQVGRFLLTRLTPALRTCDSMRAALTDLSQRCARASDLMRTRIDLQLARQNNELLAALDARTKLQMRLQQTVEGLSVAALSYYIAGIVFYLFKGAEESGLMPVNPVIAIAVAIPFIVAAVAWVVLRIRKRHGAN